MRAKDYLKRIEKLDAVIQNKRIEKEQWEDIARSVTGQMGGERVQSSGSQQKMADAMDNAVDIGSEIDSLLLKLAAEKQEIISTIEQLNATEYDLLHKVYVQHIDLYGVAEVYDKSYSWVTTVHGKALKSLQKILNQRDGAK